MYASDDQSQSKSVDCNLESVATISGHDCDSGFVSAQGSFVSAGVDISSHFVAGRITVVSIIDSEIVFVF